MATLKSGVLLAETEYGMALLDQTSAEYWTLNPTGVVILRALLDGRGLPEAVDDLTARYDGLDRTEAERDARDLLAELRTAGLLRP
ncbi:lasso peptide biosynthesis PqqD family chaperone [Streptomyces sp. JJ66]|uniref:lasso peptide biosynthesis PqqD family chaperone n=1 Tax=Streptomyces sp. JJ66 TaxID=2803843 RepID=UPI001C59ADD1|nr:lasso peptide biosynthesis PqqD family chaperone [Streptomyces sp. JJ66]MBW1604669.1 lasso peptide biosynthesis PqqD family chaperone [Streptomyces sp. JJ66]